MLRKIFILLGILFGVLFLGTLSVVALVAYFSFGLPKIETLSDYHPPLHSQILSHDGTVLAELGVEKREVVPIDEIPQHVIDSFLAAEDDNFYTHQGVEYSGILRALLINIKSGRVMQGGSTITQQVAKTFLLSKERSIARKIKDILLAQQIEKKLSKKEILFLYLNQIYLGGGYYGVKSAIRGYFDKELKEATIAESAMVAGLLVAPGKYSPYVNPAFARTRQKYVLGRMLETKKITAEEHEKAINEKIKFRLKKSGDFLAPYFTDWIRQRVTELVGEEVFLSGGFRVVTTLDWRLQQKAEEVVLRGVKDLDKRQGYLGPVNHIATNEEVELFERDFRKNLSKEKSTYFTIINDTEMLFEFDLSDDEYRAVKNNNTEIEKKHTGYFAGRMKEDRLPEVLDVGKSYNAIVIGVSDRERLIYVSLGGSTGIIPFSGYSWAYPRNLDETHSKQEVIDRPSRIVKKGDQILVDVKNLSVSLMGYIAEGQANKNALALQLPDLIKKQKYILCGLDQDPEAQGSLLAVSPKSGNVVAFVGGTDFIKSKFNRIIQSKRQPGSSFKPFIYAAALEHGFTPSSIIIDSPEALGGVERGINWKPSNYDGEFKGPITFRNALEQSRNVPTIKILDKVTIPLMLQFASRIGMEAALVPDLSMALGSFGITMWDIVASYGVFINEGVAFDPKSIISIQDRDGNVFQLEERTRTLKIQEREQNKQLATSSDTSNPSATNPFWQTLGGVQVYDKRLAYIMTNLLRGIVLHGTGASAKDLSGFVAGKTGTTNNYVDAWFTGFSSNMVVGVWTGFDNNTTLGWGETGARAALPIWKGFMEQVVGKGDEAEIRVPDGIIHVQIDKQSGQLMKGGFAEAFVEGTEPGSVVKISPTDGAPQDQALPDKIIFQEDDYFNQQ